MEKTQTAMTQFIESAKVAKEHSKDGYVSYDEVIQVASELLDLERRQHEETHFDGQRCAGSKHPSSNDASAYYATKYTNQ